MQSPTAPIRVIIIDHRAITRSALELLIGTRNGFEVVAAAGKDAHVQDLMLHHRPDVVLLSVGADTDNAFARLTALREASFPVRALLLTEATDRDLHQEAIRAGAYGIMSPESSPESLMKALACICGGEYWIDRVTAAALAQTAPGGAANGAGDGFATLTARERGIVALIADGLRNKEISARLNITETTVRHHLTSIYAKLHVSDRLELVVHAFRNGFSASAPHRPGGRNGDGVPALNSSNGPALNASKGLATGASREHAAAPMITRGRNVIG